jgi:UDP-N-acetylglucosamine transferase subunit ALG13
VILAVCSTHWHPFPRLIRLAASLAEYKGEELHVQHGHTDPVPDVEAHWVQWYTRPELTEAMRAASAVVVHGGSGCIYHALRLGIRPIPVPRLTQFGEHVDDHQLQLCGTLEREGRVVTWHDGLSAQTIHERIAALSGAPMTSRPNLRPAVWEAARALAR